MKMEIAKIAPPIAPPRRGSSYENSYNDVSDDTSSLPPEASEAKRIYDLTAAAIHERAPKSQIAAHWTAGMVDDLLPYIIIMRELLSQRGQHYRGIKELRKAGIDLPTWKQWFNDFKKTYPMISEFRQMQRKIACAGRDPNAPVETRPSPIPAGMKRRLTLVAPLAAKVAAAHVRMNGPEAGSAAEILNLIDEPTLCFLDPEREPAANETSTAPHTQFDYSQTDADRLFAFAAAARPFLHLCPQLQAAWGRYGIGAILGDTKQAEQDNVLHSVAAVSFQIGESSIIYEAQWLKDPQGGYDRLRNELPWSPEVHSMFGEKRALTRQSVQYGAAYTYNKESKPPLPFDGLVLEIRKILDIHTGLEFTQCLANFYPDGNTGIGPHHDKNHPEWVATVSFGATRTMAFSFPGKTSPDKSLPMISLAGGSLAMWDAVVNDSFKHMIVLDKKVTEPRISLTFRVFPKETE